MELVGPAVRAAFPRGGLGSFEFHHSRGIDVPAEDLMGCYPEVSPLVVAGGDLRFPDHKDLEMFPSDGDVIVVQLAEVGVDVARLIVLPVIYPFLHDLNSLVPIGGAEGFPSAPFFADGVTGH